MCRDFIFRIVLLIGFFAHSSLLANPASYLKCYNEIRAPLKAVNVFGVPISNVAESNFGMPVSQARYSEPLSTEAYIVTSKTILKAEFDYSAAKEIGLQSNPRGGGQVRVFTSPKIEVDSLYAGGSAKIFVRARWSLGLDHPNGASLEVAEEVRGTKDRKQEKVLQNEVKISNVDLTEKSRSHVLTYLKEQIDNAIFLKKGSSFAFDACYSIQELRDLIGSKAGFSTGDLKPKLVQPAKSASAPSR